MTATAITPLVPKLIIPDVRDIPIGKLAESPWNPRKHFDHEKLKQLADSIAAAGQLSPLVVRPTDDGTYEIGAGHRRYRALRLIGAKTALCRVIILDDVQFTELLNIENLQRDDIHPLEEAQGFRDLMERAGYDATKIAARVGRSEKYVYDRIKLLQLTPAAKQLFLAGEFEAGHAILLARLSPSDQTAAIGSTPRNSYDASGRGGLFELEEFDQHPDQQRLKLTDKRKPRSVRELQSWIDNNVRLKPTEVDGFLFPDTAALLTQAKEEELKVVHITHDYRVPDGARDDKQRTYGRPSWKRASKQKCDYAALDIVVGGPGRGESFMVCVRKDKCTVHWASEQKELERRRKSGGTSTARARESNTAQEARWEREQRQQDAERKRWKEAQPAILKALTETLPTLPAGPASQLADVVLDLCTARRKVQKGVPRGRTPEEFIRHAAYQGFVQEVGRLTPGYYGHAEGLRALKAIGIDAQKIVDKVSPKPVQTPAKKPAKKARAK